MSVAGYIDGEWEGRTVQLLPYQQRVRDELAARSAERVKLKAFIGSDAFASVDPAQQSLLIHQDLVMAKLVAILAQRVRLFFAVPSGLPKGVNVMDETTKATQAAATDAAAEPQPFPVGRSPDSRMELLLLVHAVASRGGLPADEVVAQAVELLAAVDAV